LAKKIGADYTILVRSRDGQEVATQIEKAMGQKPEITIECSGAPPSIQTAIYVSFMFYPNLRT
jgi:L-iditol 2-dehydrogenase